MMATVCLVVLLFLLKTKYRRKRTIILCLLFVTTFVRFIESSTNFLCGDCPCVHGKCINDTVQRCVCHKGWQGERCDLCGGRISLKQTTGFISDGVGNYSVDMQCTWLISSSQPNSTIRLKLHHFVTECSWDHLYVFDGDSAYAPLKAAYSGLIRQETDLSSIPVPELVTSTGSAYLHFYSDSAYNMSGFNISYSVESCPSNCSGNGVCIDGVCTCDGLSTGSDCSIKICPNNCSERGTCDAEAHRCVCAPDYAGEDCRYLRRNGYWVRIPSTANGLWGRASHAVTIYKDQMWIFGGERFRREMYCDIWAYDFLNSKWNEAYIDDTLLPIRRFGHSVVTYENHAYIFGGTVNDRNVTNEMWKYSYEKSRWTRQSSDDAICSVGHTATLFENQMIIIFGYNPIYGYLNYVQHYNFDNKEWTIANTMGLDVKGRFGHTSAYDPVTMKIFVFGGFQSESSTSADISNKLYTYDPKRYIWNEKKTSDYQRYLHSAVISSNVMIVYGGNTHNDTTTVNGARCYDSRVLAYDIPCDRWYTLKSPTGPKNDFSRHGHSAVVYNDSMYIFGGFNGEMLNSIVKFTFGLCEQLSYDMCINSGPGVKCIWNSSANKCLKMNNNDLAKRQEYHICSPRLTSGSSLCNNQTTCSRCLQANENCVWCNGVCQYQTCRKSNSENANNENQLEPSIVIPTSSGVKNIEACEVNQNIVCGNLHSCQLCDHKDGCVWTKESMCVAEGNQINRSIPCPVPCSQYGTCQNCSQGHCMWCSNLKRCVESNAYNLAFSYGQCMEWINRTGRCAVTSKCSDANNCEKCQEKINCGWCDNGSNTGVGYCIEGGNSHPYSVKNNDAIPAPELCPTSWHFDTCPVCQCNGHSSCSIIPTACDQPCQNQTVGKNCDRCADGFFGDPINGGNCTPCECNNHGTHCHPETGRCYCTTKGIVGNNCDRCEESGSYTGNPLDGGTCYYKLTIDYQFTFNLSKLEDNYYTQITFFNTPPKVDMDTDFTISCNADAAMNVTVKSASKNETAIISNQSCRSYKYHFPHIDYQFGTDLNTTFYVYVYDFDTPIVIQIAFTQYPKLDLLQFFITFSSCFLTLLVVAAILWKVKQKYDLYRRRHRLLAEMEQMASRPFASVYLKVEEKDVAVASVQNANNFHQTHPRKRKGRPSPIALEPCIGGKAAVLSLFVHLPTGDEKYTAPGQSGISIASTLVTLGNTHKASVDTQKNDNKGKIRKNQHQLQDSCT